MTRSKTMIPLSEAADMLGVHRSTLYRVAHRTGRLGEDGPRVIRISGALRVSRAAVQAWIDGELTEARSA